MAQPKKGLTGLKIQQQVLYILIFTFVTVVVWIGASLFRSRRSTGIAPDLLELATPLNPVINTQIIDEMESRTYYSQQELNNFEVFRIIKSRDGRVQQVVPIDSELTEIPDEEIFIQTQEAQSQQEQESVEQQDQESAESEVPQQEDNPELNQFPETAP